MEDQKKIANIIAEQLAWYPQDYATSVATCIALEALLKEKKARFAANETKKKAERNPKNLTFDDIDHIMAKSLGTNDRYAKEIRKYVSETIKLASGEEATFYDLSRSRLDQITLPKDEDSSGYSLAFDFEGFKRRCSSEVDFTLPEENEICIQAFVNCTQPISTAIDPSKKYFCPVMREKIKNMAAELEPILNLQSVEYWNVLFSLLHDLKHNYANMALMIELLQNLSALPISDIEEGIKSIKEGCPSNSVEKIEENLNNYRYILDYRDRFIQAVDHSPQKTDYFDSITVADCCTASLFDEQIAAIVQNPALPKDLDLIYRMYVYLNEDQLREILDRIAKHLGKESLFPPLNGVKTLLIEPDDIDTILALPDDINNFWALRDHRIQDAGYLLSCALLRQSKQRTPSCNTSNDA